MNQLWFLYDNTTGVIQQPPIQAATNPWPKPPTSWSVASFATTDTTAILAAANPQWYLIQGGALVVQPYWLVTATESTTAAAEYTLTATLNNPPATPPTQATFTVAGGTITTSVSNNQATTAIQLHASVASQPVPVQVSASATVSGSTTINSGTATIPLQLWTPSGGVPTVGPSGANVTSYLRQQAIGLTQANQFDIMTLNDQNLAVAVSVGLRTLVEKVIPWAKQATWSPLTLTTAEDDGLNALNTQLIPYLLGASDLLDTSGNPIPPVAEAFTQAPQVQTALNTYAQWVSEIPGA